MSKTTTMSREKLGPERWLQLKEILADALLEDSPDARARLVETRCGDDASLLLEAESLVKEAEALLKEESDSFEVCAQHATVRLWRDESPRTGWRIGAYQVLREIARGGMGALYLAARADGQFEKDVAIKVLKRGTDTEEVLRRFASERHILARLDHPNIARLLDAGTTDDGLPYFVMEYVSGAPVTRYAREHELSIDERLQLFLKICAAVEVAHHNRVIHRDLKPGNILVNSEGEPKLLDFGIAKLLTPGKETVELTAESEQRLTPICASPEQTDGRPITEASDVYALGALLYEILSGAKPHKFSNAHPSREEICRVVREQEAALPSVAAGDPQVAKRLRGDLDAIVLKALRKEPALRYQTVADFAGDIRRHLRHEPVLARRPNAAYRTRIFFARHRWARPVGLAAALIVLGGLLFFFVREQVPRSQSSGAAPNESMGVDRGKSIAVLPFDDFGVENPSYFADGVQDNILTDLGKVRDLKVVSRNAVAPYRGKPADARQIGRELGVANVLVGTVQRSGDRVRINAQLIDTRTETQVWAEHYDRKVEDIFGLQSEIAQTIVAQLKATLTTPEKAAISKRPTEDLQAYDLYLRARSTLNRAGPSDPKKNWSQAVGFLSQAIARDPKFALAYCALNEAHVYIYRFGLEYSPESLVAAKEAAETALRLEPDLEEARIAMARYYYHGLRDYRQALEQLALVPAGTAHAAEFYTLAALAERRLGRWTDCVRNGERAVALDPRNPHAAANLMQTYAGLRRYDDARRVADATIGQLPPEESDRLWLLKSQTELAAGNLPATRAALENTTIRDAAEYQLASLWLSVLEKDFVRGNTHMAEANEDAEATAMFWLAAGMLRQSEGDLDDARLSFLAGRNLIESALQRRPDDADLYAQLAEADLGLSEFDDALSEAQRAVALAREQVDALVAPYCAARLAQVLAARGERDAAIELLKDNVRRPFGPSAGDLTFSPLWDPLRNDPRFEQLLAAAKAPPDLSLAQ